MKLMNWGMWMAAAAVAAMTACGGDDDDGTPTDATVTVDSRTPDAATLPVDAAMAMGSATWTLAPFATCTGISTMCVDQMVNSPYQMASVGACPLSSSLAIYLPNGAAPPPGTYTIKPVTNLLGLGSVPTGMVAARIVHHPTATSGDETWCGQSGTAVVTSSGGKLSLTLVNVMGALNGTGTQQSMTATINCP